MSEYKASIAPLLKQLANNQVQSKEAIALEIASALAHLFDDQLLATQCASLLTFLQTTGLGEDAHVIAACAQSMREAASKIDDKHLRQLLRCQIKPEGSYNGGLCDIVGTGGDGHSTFNVSTTASIISSALLCIAKHGSQATSSKSGAADVLMAIRPAGPDIEAVTSNTINKVYASGAYCFLFAKQFHPGMKHVAPIRKQLGFRTIFNILGPLANPVYRAMEAGVYGVYKKSLGPVYANALRICGAKKAMVVCGAEDLDEISCAGKTHCWRLAPKISTPAFDLHEINPGEAVAIEGNQKDVFVEYFELEPSDFGISAHNLEDVQPGGSPEENANILMQLLRNQLPASNPTLQFVLINVAALFVISGICDAESSNMGYGDDGKVITEKGPGGGRWKEGMRRARWAVESGAAANSLNRFIEVTRSLNCK